MGEVGVQLGPSRIRDAVDAAISLDKFGGNGSRHHQATQDWAQRADILVDASLAQPLHQVEYRGWTGLDKPEDIKPGNDTIERWRFHGRRQRN